MTKLVHGLLAALLWLCVGVQFNDPDPALWVLLYGMAALVPSFALWKAPPRYLMLAALGGTIVGLVLTLPGFWDYVTLHFGETLMQEMSAANPYIEETREFLGILIALFIVLGYLRFMKAGKTASHNMPHEQAEGVA